MKSSEDVAALWVRFRVEALLNAFLSFLLGENGGVVFKNHFCHVGDTRERHRRLRIITEQGRLTLSWFAVCRNGLGLG